MRGEVLKKSTFCGYSFGVLLTSFSISHEDHSSSECPEIEIFHAIFQGYRFSRETEILDRPDIKQNRGISAFDFQVIAVLYAVRWRCPHVKLGVGLLVFCFWS
jgi:hypothetical protein